MSADSDALVIASARIEKRTYSSNPWRIVTAEGVELWVPSTFDHPMLGMTGINEPLCFSRKRDALAELARLQAEYAPVAGACDPTGGRDE